jgi:chromosome segregation ATPase
MQSFGSNHLHNTLAAAQEHEKEVLAEQTECMDLLTKIGKEVSEVEMNLKELIYSRDRAVQALEELKGKNKRNEELQSEKKKLITEIAAITDELTKDKDERKKAQKDLDLKLRGRDGIRQQNQAGMRDTQRTKEKIDKARAKLEMLQNQLRQYSNVDLKNEQESLRQRKIGLKKSSESVDEERSKLLPEISSLQVNADDFQCSCCTRSILALPA